MTHHPAGVEPTLVPCGAGRPIGTDAWRVPVAEEAGAEAIMILDSRPCRAIIGITRTYGLLKDSPSDGLVAWHEPMICRRLSRTGKFLVTLGPFNPNTDE